jgi:hypothetical protein
MSLRPATLDPALDAAGLWPSLPVPARRLACAVRALYAGSWADCIEDLRRRQAGRPYLYKLDGSVETDLAWAERLRAWAAARDESADCFAELIDANLETAR